MKMLKDLFSSKKFVVMLATIIAYAASRIGFDVSADAMYPILVTVGGYLIGQGVADAGKSAAKLPKVGELTIMETVDDKADK